MSTGLDYKTAGSAFAKRFIHEVETGCEDVTALINQHIAYTPTPHDIYQMFCWYLALHIMPIVHSELEASYGDTLIDYIIMDVAKLANVQYEQLGKDVFVFADYFNSTIEDEFPSFSKILFQKISTDAADLPSGSLLIENIDDFVQDYFREQDTSGKSWNMLLSRVQLSFAE